MLPHLAAETVAEGVHIPWVTYCKKKVKSADHDPFNARGFGAVVHNLRS